jgi:hypothetical protein
MQKKDHQLHNILNQMYVALDNRAHILTAIALRTALERWLGSSAQLDAIAKWSVRRFHAAARSGRLK